MPQKIVIREKKKNVLLVILFLLLKKTTDASTRMPITAVATPNKSNWIVSRSEFSMNIVSRMSKYF